MQIRNLRVFTLEHDALTLTWEVSETREDLAEYSVSVWRSESATGPYTRVSKEMNAQDVYEFQDRGVNLFSKWREFFYRIRATKVTENTSVFFGTTDPRKVAQGADPGGAYSEAPPDLEAMESIRRFDHVLREYAGRRVLVFPVRNGGQRCPQCWDFLKNRTKQSGCQTCFDTGFAGGYFRPVSSYAQKPAGQTLTHLTPLFPMEVNDQIMLMSSHPRLKLADVIVDIDGKRWRVLSIGRSEKGWALTRQTVQVRMINRPEAEYQIPVTREMWDYDSLTAGNIRQQIRATDIDSYHQAVRDRGVGSLDVFAEVSEIATNLEDTDAED